MGHRMIHPEIYIDISVSHDRKGMCADLYRDTGRYDLAEQEYNRVLAIGTRMPFAQRKATMRPNLFKSPNPKSVNSKYSWSGGVRPPARLGVVVRARRASLMPRVGMCRRGLCYHMVTERKHNEALTRDFKNVENSNEDVYFEQFGLLK